MTIWNLKWWFTFMWKTQTIKITAVWGGHEACSLVQQSIISTIIKFFRARFNQLFLWFFSAVLACHSHHFPGFCLLEVLVENWHWNIKRPTHQHSILAVTLENGVINSFLMKAFCLVLKVIWTQWFGGVIFYALGRWKEASSMRPLWKRSDPNQSGFCDGRLAERHFKIADRDKRVDKKSVSRTPLCVYVCFLKNASTSTRNSKWCSCATLTFQSLSPF